MYSIPLKVETIVKKYPDRIDVLLHQPDYCPLQKEMEDHPGLVYSGDLVRVLLKEEEIVGCIALGDPICYLLRSTSKQEKVEKKESCPVYQRVIQLMNEQKGH